MKEEMKIEELLNSYVDGELSVRQRTEVTRMASNNPDIAKRLRQLQKCRTLISSLPQKQAPSHIMENLRAAINEHASSYEEMPVSKASEIKTVKFVHLRRVLAAAAMISIAAVLVVVINTFFISNVSENNGYANASNNFSARLELKTGNFAGVNSVINKAIEGNGLSNSYTSEKLSNRRIYTVNCSKKALDGLLTELNDNWQELESAVLFVNTKVFGQQIKIEEVTAGQISQIANQANSEQSMRIAKDIAIINSVNKLLPESNTVSGSDIRSGTIAIPQPVLVRHYQSDRQDDGEKNVQLRIIVSR